jgi:alkanesulfonate monooxygenase SsuD/methylene tetrahydromethanopterin reductase-like flavin-dependent oxidoreductase (luciferase family)
VECGVGRGMDPAHFAGLVVPQSESYARLEEGIHIVRRAWWGWGVRRPPTSDKAAELARTSVSARHIAHIGDTSDDIAHAH